MDSDTIAGAHEYKQVQLLAALASLHTAPHHNWQGSVYVIVIHVSEGTSCPI